MPHSKASQLLTDINLRLKEEAITVRDFITLLGDRSFALCILIFSLPNSLPLPGIPGLSTLTGIPILIISLQMVWGKESIWLPKKVAHKEISQGLLSKIIGKSIPYVARLEKFLHPRLGLFCSNGGERLIGVIIAIMAFILSLPIVGGNFLPGFSISLLAIAMLERDGLFALLAIIFSLVSLALMYHLLEWVFLHTLHFFGF